MQRHSFVLLFLSLFQLIHGRALPQDAELMRIGGLGDQWNPGSSSGWSWNRPRTTTSGGARPTFNPFCSNDANNRGCWTPGFNINTNQEKSWPITGKVVRYTLEIQNLTLAPDGVSRPVYAINGQYPGPTIRAKWGDIISITVKNSLQHNGTSMHWHGVRQYRSNPMDGTNGITECPLAPGQSRTYTFLATQYGTSWYHSHHSSQYSDGVLGPIIIDGPATANYDRDIGAMPITDWFYETAFSIIYKLSRAQIRGNPRADNILINGTNVNANGGGAYHRNILEKGKKHRLRLINTGTNDNVKVSLDGHNLTVISSDFVPIVPYTTDWLFIGVGQRYDVLIDANQPVDSYWFHVVPQTGCSNNAVANAVSIFSYAGANSTTPAAANRTRAPPSNSCVDDNNAIVPWVAIDVPNNGLIPASSRLNVSFAVITNSTSQDQSIVQWNLNTTAIRAPWEKPTVQYVRERNTSYPQSMNLINLPERNTWTFWVIQAVENRAPPQSHPMHLHGHDFYVLGAGNGIYNDATSLNYINPPRRDVAMLPAGGYLVLAFYTDNPGAWLMHCHVAWHIDLGLGAQFLERASEIPAMLALTSGWNNQCSSWDKYDDTAAYKQEGSGL